MNESLQLMGTCEEDMHLEWFVEKEREKQRKKKMLELEEI
jgi:hypothetical protein